MSSFKAKDDGPTCILCFWARRICKGRDKPCCNGAISNQRLIGASSCIGVDAFDSSIIEKLQACSQAQQIRLASSTNSGYILECQPVSDLEIGTPNTFTIEGATNVSNGDLVAQLDRMVLDTFAPKIQVADRVPKSISLACLGIGYSNTLIFGKLQDISESRNKHDLSPILAELIIMRKNNIIANLMNPVRTQLELDTETRPGLAIWYLYLSIINAKLPKMGRCQMFDDSELFQHVQKILASFREELIKRFATDCKNKMHWAAGVDSQRGLVKKLKASLKPWALRLKLVPLSESGTREVDPHLRPDSYNTPHLNIVGPRPNSKVNLFAVNQPPTESASGSPALSAIPMEESRWDDKMVLSRGPGIDSCETARSGAAGMHGDVPNDMFERESLAQILTSRALTTSRLDNAETEWEHDFAPFNNTYDKPGSSTFVACSNEPPSSHSDSSHYSLPQNPVASYQPQAHVIYPSWNEDPSSPSLALGLDRIGANMISSATYGPEYNTPLYPYTSTNEPAGPNFDQNINNFADIYGSGPQNLRHDYFGGL